MVNNFKTTTGSDTIAVDLTVGDDITVGDDVTVGDDLVVTDDALVSGDLTVTGASTLTGLATLTAGIDGKVIFASTETIAAGWTSTALSLTKTLHNIDADAGGDTFTLANGTAGQIMICVLKTATGIATITPATFLGGTSITLNAAGDSVMLVYQTTLGWSIIGWNSYGVS